MNALVLAARSRRVWLAAAVAFIFGMGAVLMLSAVRPAVSSAETAADLAAEGLAANRAWWGALAEGTVPALDAVLAPEFQIMRADGSSYSKADYLRSSLPNIAAIPEFSEMVVTAHGDMLITRYFVNLNSTRDGMTVQAYAPRLTVFRKDGDRWLVSAHANFAALEQ